MKTYKTKIPDVIVIEPEIFKDDRGFFFESFNQKTFEDAIGRTVSFVQDNHSQSLKGVLRGLHYQLPPYTQAKLVRVIRGEVLDVAVDIRKSSPYFGSWIKVVLSASNKKQLWIPEGFAHGFFSKSDDTELLYKTTEYYKPEAERTIIWSCPELQIDWMVDKDMPTYARKDGNGPTLSEAEVFD